MEGLVRHGCSRRRYLSSSNIIWLRAHTGKVHISKADSAEEDPSLASKAVKLMHRFSPEDIQSKMDEVEKGR